MEKQTKNRFEKIEKRVTKIEDFIDKGSLSKGNLIKCQKCNYPWFSRSKKKLVSCPNCGTKVKTKSDKEKSKVKKIVKKDIYVKGKSWEEVAKKTRII